MDLLWRITLRIAYRAALCYWFVFRPETKGVHVALWCGGQILLIQNSYKSKQALPAGGVKRGEAEVDAAIRELREEVGISLRPENLRLYQRYVSHEEYKTDNSTVFETQLDQLPTLRIDQREVIQAEFVGMSEAIRRPLVSIVQQYMTDKRTQ